MQLYYPELIGGAWVFNPDPIDFSRYQLSDVYRDENMFSVATSAWTSTERPMKRTTEGQVLWTMRQLAQFEAMLGSRGRSHYQLDIWQATHGPAGADGYPAPLFDKRTGAIDKNVVAYMREHGYDLTEYTRRNWANARAEAQRQAELLRRRAGRLLPQPRRLQLPGHAARAAGSRRPWHASSTAGRRRATTGISPTSRRWCARWRAHPAHSAPAERGAPLSGRYDSESQSDFETIDSDLASCRSASPPLSPRAQRRLEIGGNFLARDTAQRIEELLRLARRVAAELRRARCRTARGRSAAPDLSAAAASSCTAPVGSLVHARAPALHP